MLNMYTYMYIFIYCALCLCSNTYDINEIEKQNIKHDIYEHISKTFSYMASQSDRSFGSKVFLSHGHERILKRNGIDEKKGQQIIQDIKSKNKTLVKTMIIVASPESSGNRYTVNMINKAAGCFGISGHTQPFDHKPQKRQRKDWSLVERRAMEMVKRTFPCGIMHRSFPHNSIFVDLGKMVDQIRSNGLYAQVIVLVRRFQAVFDSQVKRKHVKNIIEARRQTKRAYLEIFQDILLFDIPYTIAIYEFLGDKDYVKWLFQEIGIEYNEKKIPSFRDENKKHLL